MQSLILATSLLLSSNAPITKVETEQLTSFVTEEVNKVSKVVNYHASVTAKDTLLYQAKLVISQAKRDQMASVSNANNSDLAAE